MMILTKPVVATLSCCLLLTAVCSQAQEAVKSPVLYDEKADGTQLVAEALVRAKKENKKVLLQLGANWCGWCHRMHRLLETHAAIHDKLQSDYVVVYVDVNEGHNEELDLRYGQPTRFGLPAMVLLSAEGQPLALQDTAEFEVDDHYDPAKVLAFLNGKWSPWVAPKDEAPPKNLDINGMDTSALPETIEQAKTTSRTEGDLVFESTVFKSGDLPLSERTLVKTLDSKKTVRVSHLLYLPEKKVIAIYDFQDTALHNETHSMLVNGLPEGFRLMTSEADAISRQEWRLSKDDQVVLSYIRDADGLIRPLTREEFIASMKERIAKLSKE